jgi:hypothetical protein
VDLVIHQVVQLEHVDEADRDRLIERLTGAAIEKLSILPSAASRPAARACRRPAGLLDIVATT